MTKSIANLIITLTYKVLGGDGSHFVNSNLSQWTLLMMTRQSMVISYSEIFTQATDKSQNLFYFYDRNV